MLQTIARVLTANLGLVFFWIVFAGLIIAYIGGRPQSSRPSTAATKRSWPTWGASGESTWIAKPLEEPAEPKPSAPSTPSKRRLALPLLGSLLLLVGVFARPPQMWIILFYPGPLLIYIMCAVLSVFYLTRKRFRVLYLTGGVALAFLLYYSFLNNMWKRVNPQGASLDETVEGWRWMVMMAGAILIFTSGSIRAPAARPEPLPEP